MSKERIAIFAPSMRGGGMERVTLAIATGIANRGYLVDLLLVKGEGPFMSTIPDNINVVDFNKSRALKTLPSIIKYLRQAKPHSILCSMGHTGLMTILAKQMSFSKTKVFVLIHNTMSFSTRYLPATKRRILFEATRLLFTKAESVIGVSQGVIDDLKQSTPIPHDKLRVVYNPVSTPQLKHAMNEPNNHKWLVDKSIPVLLGAGRLHYQKSFKTLIQAFYHVVQEREARLIIVGEGTQREMLTNLVQQLGLEDIVDMPGFVDNPYSYMKNSDLFVLSSDFEGLPTVLIEAMACGCPVVSTDCPSGPKEILNNGEYGKLVPVNNPEALAKAILEELSEKHDISNIQARSEDFSEERVTDEYLSLLLSD